MELKFDSVIVEKVGHRKRCPDCWYPLVRGKGVGRFDCPNPDCPVIFVKYAKATPHQRTRVTRAARAIDP